MKTAKTQVFIYDVICPYCGEQIENLDNGSFQFEANRDYGEILHCFSCGEDCKTPKQLHGLNGDTRQ